MFLGQVSGGGDSSRMDDQRVFSDKSSAHVIGTICHLDNCFKGAKLIESTQTRTRPSPHQQLVIIYTVIIFLSQELTFLPNK